MKISRNQIIKYIEKNGKMSHPYLINLIPINIIYNQYTFESGESRFLDYAKLKQIRDYDVIDFIPKKFLENLHIFCNEDNIIEKEKKSYNTFVVTDILNKKILNMVNDNYKNEGFKYTITFLKNCTDRRFTYLDTIILKATYSLWMKGIKVFSTNQIYMELFQCYGKNVTIKKYIKDQLNSSIKYISSIMIDITFHDGSFNEKGQLLQIEVVDANQSNLTFNLMKEPILLTYAIMKNHIYNDKMNLYVFTLGRRSLSRLVLYMKLLDFVIGLHRSKANSVLDINLRTIFYECDFQCNSRAEKKKLVDIMTEYLNYFQKQLYFLYQPKIEEKSLQGFKLWNIDTSHYKVDKTHKAIRQSKQKINEIYYEELQKKELENASNSNSLDKNSFHEVDKEKEIMQEYFSDFDFDFDIDF